jgi:hypothetical protein
MGHRVKLTLKDLGLVAGDWYEYDLETGEIRPLQPLVDPPIIDTSGYKRIRSIGETKIEFDKEIR